MEEPDCEERENDKKDDVPSLVPWWVLDVLADDITASKQKKV
jgi:hypothetical protein